MEVGDTADMSGGENSLITMTASAGGQRKWSKVISDAGLPQKLRSTNKGPGQGIGRAANQLPPRRDNTQSATRKEAGDRHRTSAAQTGTRRQGPG